MKKISLKSIKNEEFLSREELKQIIGGSTGSAGSGSCTINCKKDGENIKLVPVDSCPTTSQPAWDSCPSETTSVTCSC